MCLSTSAIGSASAAPRPLAAMDAPSEAGAQQSGGKLAILPLVVEGSLSDADKSSLTQSLISGLERGNFTILAPDAVLAADAGAAQCADAACFKQVASKTGAAYVVRAEVIVRDRDYNVQVDLLSGAEGQRIARTQDGCEICGVVDASGLIDSAAATLRIKLDALAKGPASIKLASDPEGAIVTIDGEIAGTTPLERPIVPGKHLIRLNKDGFISIEREVTFIEGVGEDLKFSLEKLPNRLPSRRWGIASVVVGAVAVSAGVGLTAMDGQPYSLDCSGDNRRPSVVPGREYECRYLFATKWYGIATALAGAALLTLGTVILVNSRSKTDRGAARAAAGGQTRLGVGAGSLILQGRF